MTAGRAADWQLRCRLGDGVPSAANDLVPIARRAWHERGFVSVAISDDRLTWGEREVFARFADRIWGRRK